MPSSAAANTVAAATSKPHRQSLPQLVIGLIMAFAADDVLTAYSLSTVNEAWYDAFRSQSVLWESLGRKFDGFDAEVHSTYEWHRAWVLAYRRYNRFTLCQHRCPLHPIQNSTCRLDNCPRFAELLLESEVQDRFGVNMLQCPACGQHIEVRETDGVSPAVVSDDDDDDAPGRPFVRMTPEELKIREPHPKDRRIIVVGVEPDLSDAINLIAGMNDMLSDFRYFASVTGMHFLHVVSKPRCNTADDVTEHFNSDGIEDDGDRIRQRDNYDDDHDDYDDERFRFQVLRYDPAISSTAEAARNEGILDAVEHVVHHGTGGTAIEQGDGGSRKNLLGGSAGRKERQHKESRLPFAASWIGWVDGPFPHRLLLPMQVEKANKDALIDALLRAHPQARGAPRVLYYPNFQRMPDDFADALMRQFLENCDFEVETEYYDGGYDSDVNYYLNDY